MRRRPVFPSQRQSTAAISDRNCIVVRGVAVLGRDGAGEDGEEEAAAAETGAQKQKIPVHFRLLGKKGGAFQGGGRGLSFQSAKKGGHVFLMFCVKFSCDAAAEFRVRANASNNVSGEFRLVKNTFFVI